MAQNSVFYRDLAYIFVAALLGGLLARKLRQPLIVGYVLGGILIGPFTPGPSITSGHSLDLLAELGVILLMYSVGIEFSGRDLLRVKWVSIVGGPLGILFSVGLAYGVGRLFGWSVPQSIAIGAVISVASTMVLSRLLIDRGELHSRHGSVMIGITLVEDMAVVVITVILPLLSLSSSNRSFQEIAFAFGKSALLLVPIGFAAYKLVPPIMTRVARTRSDELYLLVALAIGFATAAVTQAVGFSLALGAFLAGMVVSESEYKHQTIAQLLPLRDAFVALFFVTMGALVNPASLLANLPLLAILIGLVIVGKFLVWGLVVLLFGYGIWTAVLAAVGLTQIGEFSFILVQVSRQSGLVGDDVYNATLATSLVTILFNAFLMRVVPQFIAGRRSTVYGSTLREPTAGVFRDHVVLCGFGRVGSVVGTALETFGTAYVVVEIDPDIVRALRERGVAVVFGDPAHINILEKAGVERASLVVFTMPQAERVLVASEHLRRLNPSVPILARAHAKKDRTDLLAAGVTVIVEPEVEASATFIRQALGYLNIPSAKASEFLSQFRGAIELAHQEAAASMPEVREIVLEPGMPAKGTLGQERVRERFGVTVLTITRAGNPIVNPSASARLEPGDRVRVFGLPEQISSFAHWLRQADQGSAQQGRLE
ncbi:MAG: cation:proton antiporter [Terriglobales bacterium]